MKKVQNESLFEIPEKRKKTWLSHSGIEGVNRCKRCFYLQYTQKIYQPEGIQSRLANRFDAVLKTHFDSFRKGGTLPAILSDLKGSLQNPFKETYFHSINENYGFFGKLDECLVDPSGFHIPIDFKTSSSDPREKDILDAYRHQVDAYVYLLEKNRKPVAGYGYLIFFYPDLVHDMKNGFPMVTHIVKVDADTTRVDERITTAIEVLKGPLPPSSDGCPFCGWFAKVKPFHGV